MTYSRVALVLAVPQPPTLSSGPVESDLPVLLPAVRPRSDSTSRFAPEDITRRWSSSTRTHANPTKLVHSRAPTMSPTAHPVNSRIFLFIVASHASLLFNDDDRAIFDATHNLLDVHETSPSQLLFPAQTHRLIVLWNKRKIFFINYNRLILYPHISVAISLSDDSKLSIY